MSAFSRLDLALRDGASSVDFLVKIGTRVPISAYDFALRLGQGATISDTGEILFHHSGKFSARLSFDPNLADGFRVRDHYGDDKNSRRELYKHVRKTIGLRTGEKVIVTGDEVLRWRREEEVGRRRENAQVKWNSARPVSGTIAETYLRSRGIKLILVDELRFASALVHPDERRPFPALVAKVVDPRTRAFKGIHITALRQDGCGKAVLAASPKWTVGLVGGGVVQLAVSTGTKIALAEGIETSLSFMQMFGWPTWAALNAGNLAKIALPAAMTEVTIAADHDIVGMRYAEAARRRFLSEGRKVRIVFPRKLGEDWNDVLRRTSHD